MIRRIIRTLIVMCVLLVLLGLLLPQSYQVHKSVQISAPVESVKHYVWNVRQWPSWLRLTQPQAPANVEVQQAQKHVGSHLNWSSEYSEGELSIISVASHDLTYQVLFDFEHTAKGTITLVPNAQGTLVQWQQTADINIPVIGPYLAHFYRYLMGNTLVHSLNNLKSVVELEKDAPNVAATPTTDQ